jgi:hypothetical protein
MVEIRNIDLKGHVPGGASIEFLRAEVPAKYRLPFVLIRYSLKGVEQDYGLRLDLDKQVFIDHFEDQEQEKAIERAAPAIVEFLGSVLH